MQIISKTVNTVLKRALDAGYLQQDNLRLIANKSINIIIEPMTLRCNLRTSDKDLIFSWQHVETPDCEIMGPSKAFLTFLLSKDYNLALQSGLKVKGDLNVANDFSNFILDLDIDWEAQLANIFGDYLARHVSLFLSNATSKKEAVVKNFSFMLQDYLQYELNLIPTQDEVLEFNNKVSELRVAVDRVNARINRLQKIESS